MSSLGQEKRPRSRLSGWLRRPGGLIFLAALVLAAAGWSLVIRESRRIPVWDAEIDGLETRLYQARWLVDQMDHGEGFQRPASMMPGIPDFGLQRLSVDLTFRNLGRSTRTYRGQEFELVSDAGHKYPPIGAQLGTFDLAPGSMLNTSIFYDFDSSLDGGSLRVRWQRSGSTYYLPVPRPPEHYHLRPTGNEIDWPADVALLLPIGKAERGESLFAATYGCSACHGDPDLPESNTFGPELRGIGAAGGGRVAGKNVAQYLYESILRPGDFIATDCRTKTGPCTAPTAMPEYEQLLTLEDMADLVAFLASQTDASPSS